MKLAFTYWQDGSDFLGYLDDYPDYETQGSDHQDLQELSSISTKTSPAEKFRTSNTTASS